MFTKKWLPSPFYEKRGNYPLDMIIIHHIGSNNGKLYTVKGTLTWFTDIEVHRNKETGKIENKVSAHYVIPRQTHENNDLYHLVKDIDIAYHAGESQWIVNGKLRKYINRYSIGIELEGDGNLIEYTNFQYDVLIWLIKDLMKNYNIPEELILGHEDIAPGRKVDPGKLFNWKRLRSALSSSSTIIPKEIQNTTEQKDNTIPNNKEVPNNVKENPTSEHSKIIQEKDENFFMGDNSKTHSTILFISKILLKIISQFFKKK